jgi:hypothetical protein
LPYLNLLVKLDTPIKITPVTTNSPKFCPRVAAWIGLARRILDEIPAMIAILKFDIFWDKKGEILSFFIFYLFVG